DRTLSSGSVFRGSSLVAGRAGVGRSISSIGRATIGKVPAAGASRGSLGAVFDAPAIWSGLAGGSGVAAGRPVLAPTPPTPQLATTGSETYSGTRRFNNSMANSLRHTRGH